MTSSCSDPHEAIVSIRSDWEIPYNCLFGVFRGKQYFGDPPNCMILLNRY